MTPTCQWCGLIHTGTCPRVKAIEYHENGTIKRVEFVQPIDQHIPEPSVFESIFGKSIFDTKPR